MTGITSPTADAATASDRLREAVAVWTKTGSAAQTAAILGVSRQRVSALLRSAGIDVVHEKKKRSRVALDSVLRDVKAGKSIEECALASGISRYQIVRELRKHGVVPDGRRKRKELREKEVERELRAFKSACCNVGYVPNTTLLQQDPSWLPWRRLFVRDLRPARDRLQEISDELRLPVRYRRWKRLAKVAAVDAVINEVAK